MLQLGEGLSHLIMTGEDACWPRVALLKVISGCIICSFVFQSVLQTKY